MGDQMLSAADLEQISTLVAHTVTEGIKNSCVSCNLSEPARNELAHFMGMVKDTGNGNYGKGVEIMRDNNKLLFKFRTRADKVGMAVLVCASIAVGGGLWMAIKEGCKVLFGNK